MNDQDRAVKAALEALGLFVGGVWFGLAPDNAPCPLLVLDVLRDQELAAMGNATTPIVTYQLRAVTAPDDDTAGTLAERAAAGLDTAPPAGARQVVQDQGLGRRRYVDTDGFFNAVTTVTIYF